MSDRIVIIGAGGHGKVIADIARKNGYTDILFLDDNAAITECGGYPTEGACELLSRYLDRDFVIAIGNPQTRRAFHEQIVEAGGNVVKLVHPGAVVGDGVTIGEGTVVMAGAVINPGTEIGRGAIINTCASVDHDCRVGEFTHISPGAHIAGTVRIGDRTWIGVGATVVNNVQITQDCIIGAGAVVVSDLLESDTYVGVPAKAIKKKEYL